MEIKPIEELYDQGKIVIFQAVYDVDFRAIFQIRENLGWIADKLKQRYESTAIINDKAKDNIETIVLKRGTLQAFISYSTFRLVESFIVPEIDFQKWEVELMEIKKNIEKIIKNRLPKVKMGSKKKPAEDLILKRIGIRLRFAVKSDQEHIKDVQLKSNIFSQQLLNSFCREEDKIQYLHIKFTPEENEKAGKSERIIRIATVPALLMNEDDLENKVELFRPVIIDYIEGYFLPPKISIRLMKNSFDNINAVILPIFRKQEEQ